jgi:hypothetical protein
MFPQLARWSVILSFLPPTHSLINEKRTAQCHRQVSFKTSMLSNWSWGNHTLAINKPGFEMLPTAPNQQVARLGDIVSLFRL